MAKSLYDLFNRLAEAEVPEKEANELVDEYLKNVSSSMTQGIKPKTEQFNPKATYGGFRFPEVSPEEIEEASASIKERQLEQTFDPILKKQEASDALRQKYASEIEAANIQKTRKEYFENKAKEEELNKKIKMRENIAESAEARGKSNFGDFVKEEAKVNKAPRTYLTPDEERILKSVEIGEIKLSDALKALKETRAAKMVSSAAKGGLKIAGRLGQVAEPFIAYKAGGELLEGLSKIPEFNNLKDEEKRQLIGDITGSGMEFAGAGLGTAGSALGLAGAGLGSGTLAALGASVAAPAAGLMAAGAFNKYVGPQLAEGAKRASESPGGVMLGRLGGDPNAVNPPPVKKPEAPVLAEEPASKAQTIDVMDMINPEDFELQDASQRYTNRPVSDYAERESKVTGEDQEKIKERIEKSLPSKEEIKDYIIQEAKKRGKDPALALAQIEQESGFNPLAISETGAKGLGQHFIAAFTDAKKVDANGSLKNLNYRDAMKPENWKAQVDAYFDYKKAIENMWDPKNQEEELRHYHGGSKQSKFYGNEDNDNYVKAIEQRKKKYDKQLSMADNVNRSPSSVEEESQIMGGPSANPEEYKKLQKLDALRRVQNFLKSGEGNLSPEDAPLLFGPVPDSKEYSKFISDQDKLLKLKKEYDALPFKREIAAEEKTEEPSEGLPTKEESPESSSAQKQAETLIAQQTSLKDDLLRAQEASAQNKFYANLARAATQIATGAAGLKGKVSAKMPDTGVFEDLQKQADLPITELDQRIKIEGEDPNSDVSNSMRELLTKDLEKVGMKVNLSGLSYNQMKDIYSPLSSMATRLETAKLKREEKADTSKKTEEEKLGKWIEKARDDINSKEIGKTDSRLKRLENGISMFEGKSGRTGAKDLAAFYTLMKGIQQDDSVIREAEQKMGMDLGGFSSKIKARFAKFFRGELFDEKQRQEMLELMKIQKDQTKNQLSDSLSSFYEDLKNQPMMKDKSEEEVNEVFKRVTPYQFNFSEIEKNKYIKKIADENFGGNVKQATEYLKQKGFI